MAHEVVGSMHELQRSAWRSALHAHDPALDGRSDVARQMFQPDGKLINFAAKLVVRGLRIESTSRDQQMATAVAKESAERAATSLIPGRKIALGNTTTYVPTGTDHSYRLRKTLDATSDYPARFVVEVKLDKPEPFVDVDDLPPKIAEQLYIELGDTITDSRRHPLT